MLRVAYLFERFPSFGQTFCYREVAALFRQGADLSIFSIRRPKNEPAQEWDREVARRVIYLPDERGLVSEIDRAAGAGQLPAAACRILKEWDRRSDFLRLYQAAFVGLRLEEAGIRRIHAHFAGMAARTAYWIRQFFGIDYSVTAHANDIFVPSDFFVSLSKIFEAAATIVTVSDFSAAQLRKQFPQNAAKVRRVYNGIEPDRFRCATFEAAVPVIVSIGRLVDKKGFHDLIAACAALKATDSAFTCKIIGDGPLQQVLSIQIAEARLVDRVQLLGAKSQEEIVDQLAAATVFVLPCRIEADGGMDNLPTVIMEAMAASLPVVSTPVAGVPEMVQPNVTGALVPVRDPAALAEAIEAVISDRSFARRLGAAGRHLAEQRFSIEANVKSLATILSGSD